MLQALYTAANGMVTQQQNLDVIGNNVANINTDGYKRSRFDFKDCLYERMKSPVDNSVEKNLQRGTGAIAYQIRTIFDQGAFATTNRPLDFVLDGEGFFTISVGEDEEPAYTRSGSFSVSAEDNMLVTGNGDPVLSEDGDRIYLPEGTLGSELSVTADGTLYAPNREIGTDEAFAKLGVVNFINPTGLAKTGEGYYLQTVNSGDPEPSEGRALVLQGYTEGSNVDYSEEVTRMIRAQRAYQFASRCIQAVDQMQQTCNSIRS